MSSLSKITIDRNQKILLELVMKSDICADCKARNPRWASHNLGIFICVGCASIHRKIGTHVTKVKSLTMDTWTKEQVESMKSMGNAKSNAIYNPNELRYPPPPNLMEAERDSEMEQYIRSKYEYKRFLDKSALVASKLGPSRSASSVTSSGSSRSVSTPLTTATSKPESLNSVVPKAAQNISRPSTISQPAASQLRSVSQPLSMMQQTQPQKQQMQPQTQQTRPTPQTKGVPTDGVWADLVSLQAPTNNSSLPLQFQPTQPLASQISQQASYTTGLGSYQTGMGMGVNPFQQQTMTSNPFSQQQQQYSTPSIQPFSAGGVSSFTPTEMLGQHQQYFPIQTQTQPPMSAPQGQFFQPRPQQGHLQIQVPAVNQTSFPSPAGQNPYMSAPVQGQFLSSSPGQLLPSHSPQPQMQMMSTTPQPQMQMQTSMQGQYMSHSPQPGMGMGMMSNPSQGQFLSTTPQPQMRMQMSYMTGAPQQTPQMMTQPQSQFGGGFQGQGQQLFTHNYGGQQWGAM